MKKVFLAVLGAACMAMASAQTVADGVKAIYYQKFKTADGILQKLVAANPADVDANYWLGQNYLRQVFLKQENLAAARAAYAKAMTTTNASPLIVVGMGHVELMEGKATDARTHFDAALAATTNKKGGDPKILTAVGRANADGDSKTGDPAYGLDKLATAAKLDLTSPDILVYQGMLQLKKGGEFGADAKKAFEDALTRDPKYALAKVRIGKIYESQNQPNLYLPIYEEAAQLDPNYAPAFLELLNYYQKRDVNKAKTYLDKYIAVSDPDCETDFFYGNYLFQAGKYQESLDKTKEIEAKCGNFPKVYILMALDKDRLHDSVAARDLIDKYLQLQAPASITGDNYQTAAEIHAKFAGDTKADELMMKAIEIDTSVANKIEDINKMTALYDAKQDFVNKLKWMNLMPKYKKALNETDIFYWGDAAVKAKDCVMADSIYKYFYIAQFPDKSNGYSLRKKMAISCDPDTSKGTAIEAIDGQTAFFMKDTAKNKNAIIGNYGYKIYYYGAKIKDYAKGLDAVNGILAIDPNNAYAKGAKEQFERLLANPPKKTPAPKTPATNTTTPPKTPANGTKTPVPPAKPKPGSKPVAKSK